MRFFPNTGGDTHGHDHLGSKAVARVLAVAAGRSVHNCLLVGRGVAGLVAQLVSAAHTGNGRLLHDSSRCPQTQPNRTQAEIEEIVQLIRLELYNWAQFCGAQAIHWRLADVAVHPLPPVRTMPHLGPARVDGSLAPRLPGRPLRPCRQHLVAFS
jgi:hypothetical protein